MLTYDFSLDLQNAMMHAIILTIEICKIIIKKNTHMYTHIYLTGGQIAVRLLVQLQFRSIGGQQTSNASCVCLTIRRDRSGSIHRGRKGILGQIRQSMQGNLKIFLLVVETLNFSEKIVEICFHSLVRVLLFCQFHFQLC